MTNTYTSPITMNEKSQNTEEREWALSNSPRKCHIQGCNVCMFHACWDLTLTLALSFETPRSLCVPGLSLCCVWEWKLSILLTYRNCLTFSVNDPGVRRHVIVWSSASCLKLHIILDCQSRLLWFQCHPLLLIAFSNSCVCNFGLLTDN